jgi:hypothetical protein
MGRLVDAQKGDYGLHNATFIAKLPRSLPSAEEWHTESDVLYKSHKGEFFYYVTTGLETQLREHAEGDVPSVGLQISLESAQNGALGGVMQLERKTRLLKEFLRSVSNGS